MRVELTMLYRLRRTIRVKGAAVETVFAAIRRTGLVSRRPGTSYEKRSQAVWRETPSPLAISPQLTSCALSVSTMVWR